MKLTAIYCISIMVSHLPRRAAPAPPSLLSLCTAVQPPRRRASLPPSLSTYVQHESSAAQSIYYELYGTHRASARRSTLRLTIPRVYRPGDCIIPRKLSRATRAYVCTRVTHAIFARFPVRPFASTRVNGHVASLAYFRPLPRESLSFSSSLRSFRAVVHGTRVPRNRVWGVTRLHVGIL